jgi:hypothetical protein
MLLVSYSLCINVFAFCIFCINVTHSVFCTTYALLFIVYVTLQPGIGPIVVRNKYIIYNYIYNSIQFNSIQFFIINVPSQQQNAKIIYIYIILDIIKLCYNYITLNRKKAVA